MSCSADGGCRQLASTVSAAAMTCARVETPCISEAAEMLFSLDAPDDEQF